MATTTHNNQRHFILLKYKMTETLPTNYTRHIGDECYY